LQALVQKTVIRMPSAVSTDRCPRHTDATILLTGREPVYVVSQRLGHASGVITQMAYAHVLPGSQRDAAERFASLIERVKHNERAGTSERHHGPFLADRLPLSPAQMSCPRGESPLTYMPAITGRLSLGAAVTRRADC
jgi:hypothetical protein